MSFPRYPKYKPSGVEWLGDVPEGWEVKPLRSVFKFSKGLTITKENLQDEGVCCVNYGEIHSKCGFRLNPEIHPLRYVDPEYLGSNSEALISDGDFVFADTSEDLEGSGNFTHLRYDQKVFAGYHTIIARPRKAICPLLLAYQFQSSVFRSQIQRQVKGVKVFSISQGILKSSKCWLPPYEEQTAIAEFLDRETGKIDGLVAEYRRLMELLKEIRQAVISHAVTKGLNPHAPMKPSGIEWLGDVPVGWSLKRLQNVCSFQSGKAHEPFICDDGIYKCVTSRFVSTEGTKCKMCSENISPAKMNDTLMVMSDLPNGRALAKAFFVGDDGAYAVNQRVCILRPFSAFPKYLYYLLDRNPEFLRHDDGINQTHLSNAEFLKPQFPFPPLVEQEAIAEFLDTELSKFDTLTAEAQRSIDLLQERRTALISAAVTGQIDVRHHPRN